VVEQIFSRIKIPRGKTLIALFLGGIILPSLILSVLSFRSIHSEVLLAQRSYEEDAESFRAATQDQLRKEMQAIFAQVHKRSTWLYDQPHSIEDLTKVPPLDTIIGVQSIFLFHGDQRVFPIYVPDPHAQDQFPSLIPGSAQNPATLLLAQLRQQFAAGHYHESMVTLELLEHTPNMQSMLHYSLREPLQWMRFRLLVQMGNHPEAIHYCLGLVTNFLQNPKSRDIESTLFVFESMFSAILSFEELPANQRELFWNLRRNLTFQMVSALSWELHRNLLEHLLLSQYQPQDGLTFLEEGSEWGFRMAQPWLPGDQMVLGVFDPQGLHDRLLKPLAATQREWKHVCFRITDARDSVLSERLPQDTLIVLKSLSLLDEIPGWTLTLYQRDMREVRKESRQKMLLLYSLVGFSLLILVLGSGFVAKGIAQERNLLTMKANFLSSISHELKTPLTSIRMFSEMMAQGRVQKPEKVIEYSGLIGKEANRLDNLIQAILSYTRMERGGEIFRFETLDLADITNKVLESLKPLAINRGLDWQQKVESPLLVLGDHASLYSLVQNLVDNAIKYTPPPGTILTELFEQDGQVVLRVTDSGIGIAPSEQKNIFNDFYRVGDEMTRSTKGSGLGLAIVRKVTETHRATISVQSRPGKGSTFTVSFKKVAHEQ